jgi:hypothetical protein
MYPCAEIKYYLDHSSCHDKMLEDSLNANSIKQKYAGKQPHMKDTVVPTIGHIVQNLWQAIHKHSYSTKAMMGLTMRMKSNKPRAKILVLIQELEQKSQNHEP